MAQHAERPIDVHVPSRALHGKAGRAGPGQAWKTPAGRLHRTALQTCHDLPWLHWFTAGTYHDLQLVYSWSSDRISTNVGRFGVHVAPHCENPSRCSSCTDHRLGWEKRQRKERCTIPASVNQYRSWSSRTMGFTSQCCDSSRRLPYWIKELCSNPV